MTKKKVIEENISSKELLWKHAFQQVDSWIERENSREEILLKSAKQLAKNVKQNQNNLIEITQQFSKELRHLEKTSRVEVLTSTTGLQALVPFKSYEEINDSFDHLWNKASEFINTPFEKLMNVSNPENIINGLEKYIEFRRNNRNLFVNNIKGTANSIQSHQLELLNTVRNQIKNVIFPFHRYLERSTKLV
ncbi:hypothetical protein ACIFOT_15845 [Neobacillus sp. NRS-1170]|uniref:hypothetical protein n=1 Tax=Neobacillus sp. NRS-1170 TaxID=3233898 RepID=UPI003D2C9307